jgi:4-diphosphocytidyl-2-C-methyl-D-erythritol kinase
MVADRSFRVHACAKINLTLRVLGIRSDGNHELRTVFQSLLLHDTLTFRSRAGPFAISCDEPSCPVDRTNLVWQAAEQVWAAGGRRGAPCDATVRLQKRIPLQAGLGGGSSDAVAAIRGLAELWRVPLAPERLVAIAATLGADVPFFVAGGTALGVECGEVLFPLSDLRQAWVVVVVPRFGVSTKDAYGWWDEERQCLRPERRPGPKGRNARQAATALGLGLSASELRNDLQGPVAKRHPAIARVARALDRGGAWYAAMSGSGSGVFGLFDAPDAAVAVARTLSGRGRRVLVTRTLGHRRFQALATPRSLESD